MDELICTIPNVDILNLVLKGDQDQLLQQYQHTDEYTIRDEEFEEFIKEQEELKKIEKSEPETKFLE